MNIKPKTTFEKKTGDHTYRFECDPDSPLGEIHDALAIMKSFVLEKIIENEKNETKVVQESEEVQE